MLAVVLIKRLLPVLLVFGIAIPAEAHNVGNAITWNREISRIFFARCASCHHTGGSAFSLMSYAEVQPMAVAIKEAVLSRRMPPWGAVKGFGDFKNDQGLTEEELGLITDWVDSDTPKGANPNVLPKEPKFDKAAKLKLPKNGVQISGTFTLTQSMSIEGLIPDKIPSRESLKVVAELPDGSIDPIIWFYEYTNEYQHPFLYRTALNLPSGTVIRGLPATASIVLIPGSKTKPAAKASFTFRGKVEKVDLNSRKVTVNGDKVAGWMESMTMSYSVDKADVLQKLKPGDQITAKVFDGDYTTLHNVEVTTAATGR